MGLWSTGREVAGGVLRSSPNPEKASFFAIGYYISIYLYIYVCRLLSSHQRSNVFVAECFVSDAWPAPAKLSPAVSWTPCRKGGSEPLTSAPRSDFMTQSLVLSIDVGRGLGISPLRIKHFAEFFSGRFPSTSSETATNFDGSFHEMVEVGGRRWKLPWKQMEVSPSTPTEISIYFHRSLLLLPWKCIYSYLLPWKRNFHLLPYRFPSTSIYFHRSFYQLAWR